jgi:regulation of enolase protein 1 (concanavalin A-like superfamily)
LREESCRLNFVGTLSRQYDQAGLMVRVSPDFWIKTSVEFEPSGPSRLGAVAANYGYSDWSAEDYSRAAGDVWLRIRREADSCPIPKRRLRPHFRSFGLSTNAVNLRP